MLTSSPLVRTPPAGAGSFPVTPLGDGQRAQIAFMVCGDDRCTGEGDWFTPDGCREWFVYEGDPETAWDCPECGRPGTRYPY